MTDSEKLDLLLEKVAGIDLKVGNLDEKTTGFDEKFTGLEKDMADVKYDLKQLHRDADFILDEVERVHAILDKHKSDKSVHTA